ncbi:MAG TPA: PEP-CTERM sorting domain-containing protein, partial [Pirellulales bacterium]|nr:PEP-CTERM sorting domain-containing protein [Pirellulales bacterium]
NSSEMTYKTMTAAGIGQANDPANPAGNWTATASFKGILTESAQSLDARYDFQFVSGPMLNQPGMQLVPGSYTAFGNNGTTSIGGASNAAGNTALGDLSNRTDVLTALTTTTDHLPVVADYILVVPEPSSVWLATIGGIGLFVVARRHVRKRARQMATASV